MKKIIFIITMMLRSLGLCAESFIVGGINYEVLSATNKTVSVSKGGDYSGDLIIPSDVIYNDIEYSVTSIGYEAFKGCVLINSISIPTSIKEIHSYAFQGCANLKSVFIDDIEWWLNLKFFVKYNNDTYPTYENNNPLENGADLYLNGIKITELSFPETISSINNFSFYHCTSIEKLIIPRNVKDIKHGTFWGCTNLKSIIFEGDGHYHESFDGCPELESIFFYGDFSYSSVYPNMHNPLSKCKKLETIRMSEEMVSRNDPYSTYSVESLFKQFPYVKEYIIPEGIRTIGEGKFRNCETLEKVIIPSSVENILDGAFGNCKNITSINIPNGVKIVHGAFSGCDALKRVDIQNLSSWCNISFGNSGTPYANPLYNKADLYLNGEKVTNLIIPDDVTSIKKYAFAGCTSIESIIIPNTVKTIYSDAFRYCENLSYVKYPQEEVSFQYEPFRDCPLLVSAGPYDSGCSIEYGWETNIPSYAFLDIKNLSKLLIPSTITSIGTNFINTSNLKDIYINATTPPSISSNNTCKANLFVPGGTSPLYSTAKFWKDCKIIELVYIEDINFVDARKDLIAGNTTKLEVDILPSNATYQTLFWQSSNNNIATVDGNGNVTALKTGYTRITASTTDGTDLTTFCDIYVTNPVAEVMLDTPNLSIEVGLSVKLSASCLPNDADDTSIVWKSDDETIANVDNGLVTGLKLGKTKIKACSVNGIEAVCEVLVIPTLATSISINEKEVDLLVGDSFFLEAIILPENATSKDIIWSSDDISVVKVNELGEITAVSNGSAYIWAKTTDGSELSDKCQVSVTTLAQAIELNKGNCDLIVGEGTQLIATIVPSTTSNRDINWKSSNEQVVIVTETGYVTALSTGRCSITAMTQDGTNIEASCSVSVTNPVMSISINKETADIKVGEELQLLATCIPSNADDTSITWYSSDASIATIENGLVIGKALGEVTIIANSVNGKEARCQISVVPTPISAIHFDKSHLYLNANDIYRLTAEVFPSDATDKTLSWKSSDMEVATIDSDGVITALTTGISTITATTTDGTDKCATCFVHVSTPVLSVSIIPLNVKILIDEQIQLEATIYPENADNKSIEWKSSDMSIADVSNEGIATGKSAGVAVISATTMDGTSLYAESTIKVEKHSQNISWVQDITSLSAGGSLIALTATSSTGLPITYTSSNEEVVSIFDLGDTIYLNPNTPGATEVTALQAGNFYYAPAELTKTAIVVDPNGIENIPADGLYTIYTLNGIKVGCFNEEEYRRLQLPKGAYVVNGKIILK